MAVNVSQKTKNESCIFKTLLKGKNPDSMGFSGKNIVIIFKSAIKAEVNKNTTPNQLTTMPKGKALNSTSQLKVFA